MEEMKMSNLNNCLVGLGEKIEESCFQYLKSELEKKYSFVLVEDILALPCMRYRKQSKLSLLFSLWEDNEVNDTIISTLCQLLNDIPGELWRSHQGRLRDLIEGNYAILNRSQLLLLAHTVEVMYARGYENTFQLLNLIYQRIALYDYEFNPDSDENVRIKLAKIAYSTSIYNIQDKLNSINAMKHHLKISGRECLLGVLNYYKGLCLEIANHKIGYKDCTHYLLKSRNKGFVLAAVHLDYYNPKNVEMSMNTGNPHKI